MKPSFALSLSFEGISLLHRAAGGWRSVGDVGLDSGDLKSELAQIHAKALLLEPDGFSSKIIIPNEQIRYLSVETGSFTGDAKTEIVRAALANATPYPLDDLVFDTTDDGPLTHVAAVARETLDEAESFAVEHDFAPVSLVAIPGDHGFLGEPFFGQTRAAKSVFGGAMVEPDGVAVVVVGAAELPEVDAVDDSPVPGFASRRRKSAAPALAGVSRDVSPPRALEAAPDPIAPAPYEPASDDPAPYDPAPDVPDDVVPEPGLTTSVSAPAIDIPQDDDTSEPEEPPQGAFARFLSRNKSESPQPEPLRPPVQTIARSSAPVEPRPIPPDDETARMTVFGARDSDPVGGKPRFLGLILTAGLLIFLALVALWATLFLEDGIAGLIPGSRDDATEIAQPITAPQTDSTGPEALQSPAPTDRVATPSSPQPPTTPDTPQAPSLTDTDVAVLDALREPDPDLPQTEDPDENTPALDTDALTDPPRDQDAQYAVTGIWQDPPQTPETPAIIGLDNLFIAAIDRTDLSQDAVALPSVQSLDTDTAPGAVGSPVAANVSFALDSRGLVEPTVQGTINPDGVLIFKGRPAAVPPSIPVRFESAPETDVLRQRLAELRPRLRPKDLVERAERASLGGLTRAELAEIRPKARPETLKREAEEDETPTAQAVARSVRPDQRPRNFASTVENAEPARQVAAVAPRTVTPSIPSSASVARQATLDNAINLRKINLIGVYGTPSNRRALVRLPSGRYKKVKVGDSVDGGRVLAIGDSELRYQKGGRNLTLKIPSG